MRSCANGARLANGLPGTGKTVLLQYLLRIWKTTYAETNVVCNAYTRDAALFLPCNRTLEHWRKAYKRQCPANTVCVDEISMLPLTLLNELARYKNLNARFVLLGDF